MANEIYNTTWWGNAIDTARTAGTNPDFFGSQMKLLTSEQDDLVTNGDFATDSDWTKGTGWSISDGVATYNGSAGTVSLVQNNIQNIELEKTCKITLDVLSNEGNGANTIYLGGTVLSNVHLNVGSHTFYGAFTTNTNFYIYGRSGEVFKIDNVSVQLVRCDLDQIEAKKCLADWIHRTALQDLNN